MLTAQTQTRLASGGQFTSKAGTAQRPIHLASRIRLGVRPRTVAQVSEYDGVLRATVAKGGYDVTRYVIGPDVALLLAERRAEIPVHHRLLAPTLLRSQVLAQLYSQSRQGLLAKTEAASRLDYLRSLQIRLLGDRALQQLAWKMAQQLDWADTFVAEYLALTELQGDALVVLDVQLCQMASKLVPVAAFEQLLT